MDTKTETHWYAVSTRSRQEKVAAQFLESAGIPHLLPLVTEIRKWSDRKKTISIPLFAGYVFVQIPGTNETRVQVLKTPGVVQFVGIRGIPLAISEKEIRDIQSVLSSSIACSPYPFLNIGQRVRIVGGALDQVEGTLVGRGPGTKLVISVQLIQRSLAISVCDFEVEPVGEWHGAVA
ncbi:MAG TPA: UpxY family transcription antiterminator [Terriglobales bacterium]|jgi:transcription antitermination factor NusG